MNILILSWRGPGHPQSGGAEIATFEHARGWVNAGYKVTLFTSYFKSAKAREIIDGVEIIRQGEDAFGVKIMALFWYLFGDHPKFNLVVDEFHGIPFFTPLYVRGKKLAWIHEVAKEVWWFNPWPKPFNLIPAIIGTIFERFVFMILYRNVPFMTVSKSTRRELVAWGIPRENITVIYNGINRVKVKTYKEKKKTAIFLGVLTKDKGIEDALDSFSLINKSDNNWKFWVVGRGEKFYMEFLKKRGRNLGILNKVKFWGYVDDKEKFELLAKAHVLVNPSIREGWGMVNVEAAFSGTPVVGYAVPGVKDSVKNNKTGLLVQKGNTPELALNCLELMEDRKRYEGFKRRAMAFSKEFSWEKSSRQSLKLIERICKK